VIPNAFSYERVTSVAQALERLQENPEAKLLAGGHSLLPLMKMRLANPEVLIDIGRIAGLCGIRQDGNRIVIGALTTHAAIAVNGLVREMLPALAEAAGQIGDLQVRNRGTVGGNLAHADPSSDLPAVAVAYNAQLKALSRDGEEVMDADGFFLGPLTTALPEGAMLTEVSFEIPPAGTHSVYHKVPHPASGYAVVGIAAVIGTDYNGRFNYARLGVTGAGDVAYRAQSVEAALLGQLSTVAAVTAAAKLAALDGVMGSDLYASEAYRTHLVQVHMARAILRAFP